MGIEELKKDWDDLSESTEQNILSNKQIKSAFKSKYRSRIYKTFILELLVLMVYAYFIALTIFRFNTLEKNYLEILGIILILILVLLFIIRTIKLIKINKYGYLNYSHAEVLEKLALQKISLQKFYLFNIISGFFLIMALIILNVKIYNEYDIIQNQYFWFVTIPISFIFIVLINKWIKKYYKKAINEAEELIQELNNKNKGNEEV